MVTGMILTDRIYVAGHKGLVGSAVVRRLRTLGYKNVFGHSRMELDLRDRAQVDQFFAARGVDYIFLAAAMVGGIRRNMEQPANMIFDNLQLQINVIDAAYRAGVKKLLFLGSSCIYPRECPQPMRETSWMTGPLEPTNSAYAMAKCAGIEMLDAYKKQFGFASACAMPTNLYGPNDSYDLNDAHVLPALIRRFHEAKMRNADEVVLWGTGVARREFLHVDDCAAACVLLMQKADGMFNVGAGEDLEIRELAAIVAKVVGFAGTIRFGGEIADGMPRKLLDCSRLRALDWKPTIGLEYGIKAAYQSFLAEGT
jgi:GDP-L-fucose synthase